MYDHYIAFDWAQKIVAVARMSAKGKRIQCFETEASTKELRVYLKSLSGKKILTIEESSTSQWLYTEFRDSVDELIICEPRRNRLLQEGAKNDKIDAQKLVRLLKADLLKPVFHSADEFIYLRKLVSGYKALVKAGVRSKNQRSALFIANGLDKKMHELVNDSEKFVLTGLDRSIELYQEEKQRYEREFARLKKEHKLINSLCSIPGVGKINAVHIAAIVVDPRRFPNRKNFLSYCGLVKHVKMSGGNSYGKRTPHFNRVMKTILKTAALVNIYSCKSNHFNSYHEYLMREKNYADFNARHAVARRIGVIIFGVLKTQEKFNPDQVRCEPVST